jgi:hypothetical protein
MADIIPPANLNPDAQPWGRHIQQTVVDQQYLIALNAQTADNNAKQLTSTINVLTQQVNTGLGNVYNKSEVDSRDAAVAATAQSNLNTGLATKQNTITILPAANGGTSTSNAYNNTFSSGSWRATWTLSDGTLGYAPSSRDMKTDFEPTQHSLEGLLSVDLQSWRYKSDVEANGDDAVWRTGFIAEDIHDSGETWLVDYDEDGVPAGLAEARFGMAAVALLQKVNKDLLDKINMLEQRISVLENKVN